ncbi:MAG: hypothetical protein M1608_00425, partial [Candidatus Omnitrophica bacterium]|nr:hypothetical protein [Candidatus Omnitrophota bacterium]
MEIICPACGKLYENNAGTACQRCGCDLANLASIAAAAAAQLSAASASLQAAQWSDALQRAERSWSLR